MLGISVQKAASLRVINKKPDVSFKRNHRASMSIDPGTTCASTNAAPPSINYVMFEV
jgi:hypothetical protein